MPWPNESPEAPDPRSILRSLSINVYDGNRLDIEKPDDMSATEALALLNAAAAHIAAMQWAALRSASPGTKLVRPIQRVGIVRPNGRRAR